jgi:RHS repeat-associated protein
VGNRGTATSPGKLQINYYPPGVPSTKNESYYTHDDNNKMQTEAINKYVWSGGAWVPYDTDVTVFEYDGNGNMTRQTLNGEQVTDMAYDCEDRLTQIALSGDATDSFVYYGSGLRRSKVDSLGTRNYYYDGDDILAESNGAGSFPVSYTYGALGLVSEVTHPGPDEWYTWWHHGSFIGSVNMVSVGGAVQQTYEYDAYGIPLNDQSSAITPFRYVGQLGYYKDPDHRMMLLGARYYDPYIGRFITQDPAGYDLDFNLYPYANNSPTALVDPSGLAAGFVLLPAQGPGYYTYGDPCKGWGTQQLIDCIQRVGKGWSKIHDKPLIGVGDIGYKGGGHCPPHAAHRWGKEVDVRPMRSDLLRIGVTYKQKAYSRALTQELVDLFYQLCDIKNILFNDMPDRRRHRPGITGVRGPVKKHDNHLHVNINLR